MSNEFDYALLGITLNYSPNGGINVVFMFMEDGVQIDKGTWVPSMIEVKELLDEVDEAIGEDGAVTIPAEEYFVE